MEYRAYVNYLKSAISGVEVSVGCELDTYVELFVKIPSLGFECQVYLDEHEDKAFVAIDGCGSVVDGTLSKCDTWDVTSLVLRALACWVGMTITLDPFCDATAIVAEDDRGFELVYINDDGTVVRATLDEDGHLYAIWEMSASGIPYAHDEDEVVRLAQKNKRPHWDEGI